MATKHIPKSAESRLSGTGLLSKQQAFKRSGVSWSTFIRALSINFNGNKPTCGKTRTPGLRATYIPVGPGINIVAVDPKHLKEWKRQRGQLSHNGLQKKKRLQSIHKNGDQARERRTNESAR